MTVQVKLTLPVLAEGSTDGGPVGRVQQMLNVHAGSDFEGGTKGPLQVDGVFGPKTEAAVRGFQDALDITVDGIVGPVTWRALVSGMLSF